MCEITLRADYNTSGLFNDLNQEIDIEQLSLPFWLKTRLKDWVAAHTPLDIHTQEQELAQEGLALAIKLQLARPDLKIRYFNDYLFWRRKPHLMAIQAYSLIPYWNYPYH